MALDRRAILADLDVRLRRPMPMDSGDPNVTNLLAECRRGDRAALERLIPIVYQELRRLASARLRNESGDHTLQTTALVHEAYCGWLVWSA
jgi:hypothetical protein